MAFFGYGEPMGRRLRAGSDSSASSQKEVMTFIDTYQTKVMTMSREEKNRDGVISRLGKPTLGLSKLFSVEGHNKTFWPRTGIFQLLPQGYPFSQGSRDVCLELLKLPGRHKFIKGFCSTSASDQVTSSSTQSCTTLGSDWQLAELTLIPRESLP